MLRLWSAVAAFIGLYLLLSLILLVQDYESSRYSPSICLDLSDSICISPPKEPGSRCHCVGLKPELLSNNALGATVHLRESVLASQHLHAIPLSACRRNPNICSSVNRFFTSNRLAGARLKSEALLKRGGGSRSSHPDQLLICGDSPGGRYFGSP